MAYVKVPAPSVVYHLAKADRLDSILDDGQIRRFEDSECWFCESLPKMKAYMEQTVMCEGKPYYAVGGQLCRYPKFVPEDYVLLKLAPCQPKDNWYRWDQEVPPGSPKELINAAKDFSALKIGYRGDLWFSTVETIDVPAFLHGEIIIIGLVGLLNFFNAMMTGILSRRREFAVLQAVGMTNRQLKTMLIYEGLFYAMSSVAAAFILSLAVGPLAGKMLGSMFWFFEYRFTILPVLLTIPVFLLLGWLIPCMMYDNAAKCSVVEQLRDAQ